MRYLAALGIDGYVSRQQLPGAAPTRRLALVPANRPVATPEPLSVADPTLPVTEKKKAPVALGEMLADRKPAPRGPGPATERAATGQSAGAVRFSLAAIFVGQIAWIEALGDNPLAREQVQLVHAMARAVSGKVERPEVTQFDWPTHQNQQLDLGPEAARDGVAGFLQRQLEQRKCRGLVVLGAECEQRVPLPMLGNVAAVVTDSTLAMLGDPQRKRQVWRDLQPLVLRV